MTTKTRADYKTAKDTTFADNTAGDISALDLRNETDHLSDSALFKLGDSLTAVTPMLTDKVVHQDTSDSDNLKTSTAEQLLELGATTSAGAPSSAPNFIGQIFNDTLNDDIYIASGTSTVADWLKVTPSAGVISFTGTASGAIAAGDPVYFSGGSGVVSKCDSDTPSTFPACGVAAVDIADTATGSIVVVGEVSSLDTSGFGVNDTLYPDSGGGLTNSEPATGSVQPVALVKSVDAASGIILVQCKLNGSATIKRSEYIDVGYMVPTDTNGATATQRTIGGITYDVGQFVTTGGTDQHMQFKFRMPKGWDEGTVTYKVYWTHTGTTSVYDTDWILKAAAISNDDTLGATFGTGVTVQDTGGTDDDLYISPESSALTVGGTPAEGDLCVWDIALDESASGLDSTNAELLGVEIFYTINTFSEA